MNRFKNILLVCDEKGLDDEIIDRAVWLAARNDARVTLVDVVQTREGEFENKFGTLPWSSALDFEGELLEFSQERLARFGAPLRSKGIETETVVLQGIVFVEVIRKVLKDRHDFVIKGASSSAGSGPFHFASTDLHLFRKCPCPVWVLNGNEKNQYSRLLAAVDPDPENQERDTLNKLIMDLATSLAELNGSELHVLNAWHLEEEPLLRNKDVINITDEEIDMLLEVERTNSQKRLENLMRGYLRQERNLEFHLVEGAPERVVPEFARDKDVDLIIMGTVTRTGIHGFFIGNTAEAILNRIECSVLAVKPSGFQTPVQV